MVPGDFVDHFTDLAGDRAEHDAVVLIRSRGDEYLSESISYAELDRAARSIAVWLQSQCSRGDRILLLYPTDLEFVRVFLGCLYAGLVPVPAPVPDSGRHHLMRATGVALDSDARIVLTNSQSLVAVSDWVTQDGLDDLSCVATDKVELDDAAVWARQDGIGSGTTTLLQYTSGSTSDPKGVMITHGNLLHNLQMIRRTFGLTETDKFCSWLPLFNDIGLVEMLLTPLFLGATVVLMPPGDFFERPYRWLEIIDRCDIQFSSAPSCAYDLCVGRISDEQVPGLDLSRWRHACCNGTDPVDPGALGRFVARFAPTGFHRSAWRISYGMTETTLLVSGSGPGAAPVVEHFDVHSLGRGVIAPATLDASARSLVGSGSPCDLDVRIVEPRTAEVLADGQLGEVWIRGGSVAAGYWRKKVETERTFNAVTATGEVNFLRTGDLGGFHSGQLYVVGRIDEVLVVRGRYFYPNDIEHETRLSDPPSFAGLSGSVFTVPAPQSEIVVLHELQERAAEGDLASIAGQLRSVLCRHLGVRVENIVFVTPGKVRKTITSKVNRSLMRELFLADALDPVYEQLGVEVSRRYRPTVSPLASRQTDAR